MGKLAIELGDSDIEIDLSEQRVLSCTSDTYCSGNSINSALDYLQNTGTVAESCFSYQHEIACDLGCPDSSEMPTLTQITGYALYYPVGNPATVDEIKQLIFDNGPVVASMEAYEDFSTYADGVYEHLTGNFQGNKSIMLLGWGNEAGTDYWEAMNSWGTAWGEDGFIRIKMGEVAVGEYIYSIDGIAGCVCADEDADGYVAAGCNDADCTVGDCDDSEAAANADAAELCDGIDNDCDGDTDEGELCLPAQECIEGQCQDVDVSTDSSAPAANEDGTDGLDDDDLSVSHTGGACSTVAHQRSWGVFKFLATITGW